MLAYAANIVIVGMQVPELKGSRMRHLINIRPSMIGRKEPSTSPQNATRAQRVCGDHKAASVAKPSTGMNTFNMLQPRGDR